MKTEVTREYLQGFTEYPEVTTEYLQTFVGGQMEVQNSIEDYIYRGQISTAEVIQNQLVVTFEWLARLEIAKTPDQQTRWVPSDRSSYAISLLFYSVKTIGPGEQGSDRLCLLSGVSAEVAILFPPNGSRMVKPF
jgi:hypothetical protein